MSLGFRVFRLLVVGALHLAAWAGVLPRTLLVSRAVERGATGIGSSVGCRGLGFRV